MQALCNTNLWCYLKFIVEKIFYQFCSLLKIIVIIIQTCLRNVETKISLTLFTSLISL